MLGVWFVEPVTAIFVLLFEFASKRSMLSFMCPVAEFLCGILDFSFCNVLSDHLIKLA
jgi:hypothetical protein